MAGPVIERCPVAHGSSYGGCPTLVALTRWAGLSTAGATLAGMSDVHTFFAGTAPWAAATSGTGYGDPVGDRLVELSGRVPAWFDRRP